MSLGTHQEELDLLKKLGFPINPYNTSANNLQEIWAIQKDLSEKKQSLKYPIDGLVIKLNDNQLVEKLGAVGKTNRAWAAIKFAANEVSTKLLGVTWQVGRTGRVVPVAELEPVELDGTTVKRATLHNYKELIERKLTPNDTLIIRKAGDIIPEVVNILENLREASGLPFPAPKTCPECHTELVLSETNVDLYCPNIETCPSQIIGRLSYYAQRNIANIVGLSEKIIQKFIELYGVTEIPDLYDLPYEKIQELEGFGQKSVKNLEQAVEASRVISAEKFLAGLGIEGVGSEVAKLIVEKLIDNS